MIKNALAPLISSISNTFCVFKQNILARDYITTNRRRVFIDNCLSNVAVNLAGGTFFTGLLLYYGARDSEIGIATILATVANMLYLFAPMVVERFQKRKVPLIIVRSVSYFLSIGAIMLTFFIPCENRLRVVLVIVFTMGTNIVSALTGGAFSIWHIKFIPEQVRPRYFSTLIITNSLLWGILGLASSRFVDILKSYGAEGEALITLRMIALVIAALDIFILTRIDEPLPYEKSENRINLFDVIVKPLREKKYLCSVAIYFLWTFFTVFQGPYMMTYLLNDLKVSYSYISIASFLAQMAYIAAIPFWSRSVSRRGWLPTLILITPFYSLHYLMFVSITKDSVFVYIISLVFVYIFNAAASLVMSNLAFINLPQKDQSVYLCFYSIAGQLSSLLSNFVSREFITRTDGIKLEIFGLELVNKQYYMFLNWVIAMLCWAGIILLVKRVKAIDPEARI